MIKFSEIAFCFALLWVKSSGFDLKDITGPVFGDKIDFLPAAFGDFNSDKLTDLIVFDNQKKSVAVLVATEQSVVNIGSDTIFRSQRKSLNCSCPQGKINI